MIDLAKAIASELENYSEEAEEILEEEKEKAAIEAVQELRKNSPRRLGKYARGWRKKRIGKAWVIYNIAPTARLSHLLEKGHVKRDGGRVKAYQHIKPVEEKVIKELMNRVDRRL